MFDRLVVIVDYTCTFGSSCPLTEFCPVQNSLYVQVWRSPILAALLHGSPAAGVSQTAAWYKEWNCGTFAEGATYIRQGDHHVGHWPTFLVRFDRTPTCDGQTHIYTQGHSIIIALAEHRAAKKRKYFIHG